MSAEKVENLLGRSESRTGWMENYDPLTSEEIPVQFLADKILKVASNVYHETRKRGKKRKNIHERSGAMLS